MRSLSARPAADIRAQVRDLFRAQCTCFDQLEGSALPFNFNAGDPTSRTRLRALRQALLANIWRMPPPIPTPRDGRRSADTPTKPGAKLTMLYVPRLARVRAVTNEVQLHAALRRSIRHLRRVVLDDLSITEQMRTVSQAHSLLATFGQALTWMVMLPPPAPPATTSSTSRHRAAPLSILELAPRDAFWKKDYEILAGVLGMGYQRVYGTTAQDQCVPEPPAKLKWQQQLAAFNRWLHCNLTMDIPKVVRAARRMAISQWQAAQSLERE